MVKKVFWFDVETTGLDPLENDIIQLAFLIEINGEIIERHNLLMHPFNEKNISLEALQKQKRTLEEIRTYPNPREVYKKFINIIEKYVDRYDPSDKFHNAGYNSKFDMDFLRQFFIKNGDVYFGSWFNYKGLDPLPVLHLLDGLGYLSISNYQLETVCSHFNIPLDAHDALNDINATRALMKLLCSNFIVKK
jgi:DNA polymerase III subunit epsilon